MKRINVVLLAFLIAVVAGWASAQDVPAKAGSGPALKEQPKKAGQAQTPNTYGTSFSSFYRMGAAEFTGMQTGGAGSDLWNDTYYADSTKVRRYGTTAFAWLIGTPHLPSGAQVLRINIEDCVNAANSISGDILSCNADGDGCTVLTTISTIAGCGYDTQDISGAGYVVNNAPNGNYLVIRAQLFNTDGSDSIAGASIEYQLQVSPAPGSPTFADVQPSNPQYQFVEALVASGITAGCGGGNYCPNNPVTRGQMAVFIAKALGLQWP